MNKVDALEAVPIMNRALTALLEAAPTRGREGADLRSACGYLRANAAAVIQSDAAGAPLANCFNLAIKTGMTQKQASHVRSTALSEAPGSVGAVLIRDAIVEMSLAAEGRIIADIKFVSRDEVEALKLTMTEAFAPAEEAAADKIDAMTYRALVTLRAAIVAHLTSTAYPLPRMLSFQFAAPMTTLSLAHRLYDDAGRADDLREQNQVVHPAFAPPKGRALSA